MAKTLATWFGVIFLLLGVLGFIPGVTTDDGLFGIFHVDMIHNIIHLLTGVLALWMGMSGESGAKGYFKLFGVIYAIVAILGFFQGDSEKVIGLFVNNAADTWLHVVVALVFLWAGFSGGSSGAMPSGDSGMSTPSAPKPTM